MGKWFINDCGTYLTLNNTEFSNRRQQLTTTFAKCNLHKWNNSMRHNFFFSCGDLWRVLHRILRTNWESCSSYILPYFKILWNSAIKHKRKPRIALFDSSWRFFNYIFCRSTLTTGKKKNWINVWFVHFNRASSRCSPSL